MVEDWIKKSDEKSLPIKKRQRINDLSFSSIKLRYLNSASGSQPSSPEKKHRNLPRPSSTASHTPGKQTAESPSKHVKEEEESKSVSPKKVGKFNFLTDLEIKGQIQTIMNNEVILKNLLLSIVSSVKSSKSDMQELTKNSKANNEELSNLIKTFANTKKTPEVTKELNSFYNKIAAKLEETGEINDELCKIAGKVEKFEPMLEKLNKEGGFPEAKQTEMTYNIIRANRAEALSILKEITTWREAQEAQLRKLEAKVTTALKTDSSKENFLLLNNLNQMLGEQLHLHSVKTKKPLSDLQFQMELMGRSISAIKSNTESNKNLSELGETFASKFSKQLDVFYETLTKHELKNEQLAISLSNELKQELKKSFIEKLVTDEDMKLLNDRLNKWSGNVDKNISQLLISSLNSKFQKVLTETIKNSLLNNAAVLHKELTADKLDTQKIIKKELLRVQTDLKNNITITINKALEETLGSYRPTSFSSSSSSSSSSSESHALLKKELEKRDLQNQLKDRKIKDLEEKVAKLEQSSTSLHEAEKLKKYVTSLENKKTQLKTELKYLNESYTSRYNEFDSLLKKHNDLLTTFNNLMFDKYKNIFGASAMVLLNKNNTDNNTTSPTSSYTSPLKASVSPRNKKVLSPLKNRVATSNSYNVKKRDLLTVGKENSRNFSLNLENTREEKENI